MARIKAPTEPPRAPTNIRGALVFRLTKDGIVVAKWPRKRGRAREGSQLYRQLEFGKAAYIAAHPNPIDQATAYDQVAGTTNITRDHLQMAAMGSFWTIIDEDGNEWKGWRMVQANAQFMLDQVTDQHGALLYRAPIGWVGLDPGADNLVLRMGADGMPFWSQPAQGQFAGATLIRTSNLTAQNWTTETIIPWQAEALNHSGWPTLAGSGTRIGIPDGITIAQAFLALDLTSVATTASLFAHVKLKNAAGTVKRQWRSAIPPGNGEGRPNMVTTPWPVVPTDFFDASCLISGDTSITMNAATSAFSVQGW